MKVFLDTNVWLSATVFAGLCAEILTESAQRNWLLTTRLVQAAQAAGALVFVTGDRRVLGWCALGDMQILSPRDVWMHLFVKSGGN